MFLSRPSVGMHVFLPFDPRHVTLEGVCQTQRSGLHVPGVQKTDQLVLILAEAQVVLKAGPVWHASEWAQVGRPKPPVV